MDSSRAILPPPTMRSVWCLAWPAVISVVLNNAFRVVDQYSVQWLGYEAQAAIGSCTFVLIFFFALYELVSGGTGPLMARAIGARETKIKSVVLGTSFSAGTLLGLSICTFCVLFASSISSAIGLTGETERFSTEYLRHLGYAGLPLALSPIVDASFIAMGRTRLVMGLHGISTVLNLVLNFWLIYGLEMGIAGAAWASSISRTVVLIPAIFILWREIGFASTWYPRGREVLRILKVGFPISMNTAAYALVYWGLLRWVISPLGPEVNASLGIGFSALENFTWPVFHGVSLGVASLVGRYMGAGRLEDARRVWKAAVPLSCVLGVGSAIVFFFGAEFLCRFFTSDPDVLRESILYARVLAFSQLFVALEALAEGVLAGSGDTRTLFWLSAPINVLRIPLGFYLAFTIGLGALGVWWAINLTTIAKAIGKGWAVIRGRWVLVEL